MKDYSSLLTTWFHALSNEEVAPTSQQLEVLHKTKDRILLELRLEKEGILLQKAHPERAAAEEPLRGFVHGSPGTGKSKLINWIRRMFEEALAWKHEEEFLCVAFQNRVAYAMGGTTLHASGEITVGNQSATKLTHTDIDLLFTRNQHLRWLIIDEGPMIPDDLLGAFEHHLADAAVDSRYKKRSDKSVRPLGGYNVLILGDFYQIPPIPASASLSIPLPRKNEHAQRAWSMFWNSDADALNYFIELTIQKRVEDPWYSAILEECRYGHLSDESYHFLLGLPTEHAGSWNTDGTLTCKSDICAALPATWRKLAAADVQWSTMQTMECIICKKERDRRNRLLESEDERVRQEPFLSAPFIHKNNEPKYHAMLLRAAEEAKANRVYTMWFAATDTPENPAQIVKKPSDLKRRLERFLQLHDQQTSGIPGLNILYEGLRVRVTEKLVKNKKVTILKHSPARVVGWELHPADRVRQNGAEIFLHYQPLCILSSSQTQHGQWTIISVLACGHYIQWSDNGF